MQFAPKIYFNKQKRLVIDLVCNGQIVDIEDCVPVHFRSMSFDKDAFDEFWQITFPFWLVNESYADDVNLGTKENPTYMKWADYIDLAHFGLVSCGLVNEDRLKFLVKTIIFYWDYTPNCALLYLMYRSNPSDENVATTLKKLSDPEQKNFDLTRLNEMTKEARKAFNSQANKRRLIQKEKKRRRKR